MSLETRCHIHFAAARRCRRIVNNATMHHSYLLALAIASFSSLTTTVAFVPDHSGTASSGQVAARKDAIQLRIAPDASLLDAADMTVSRTAFFLCLFGATGTAAAGRVVIPITWQKFWAVQALKGEGTSLGGRELEIPGYPEPIYENDILEVMGNNMTIPEIVKNFPIEDQIPGK